MHRVMVTKTQTKLCSTCPDKPERVAVCRTCMAGDYEWNYFPENEIGSECPQDHDDDRPRKLTPVRLFICRLPDHCESHGFADVGDLHEHQYEHYHDLEASHALHRDSE